MQFQFVARKALIDIGGRGAQSEVLGNCESITSPSTALARALLSCQVYGLAKRSASQLAERCSFQFPNSHTDSEHLPSQR